MVKDTPGSGTDKSTEVCTFCDGTGQTGQFRGVSRFVISWEDCPDCHGTGVIPEINANDDGAPTKSETSPQIKKDKE